MPRACASASAVQCRAVLCCCDRRTGAGWVQKWNCTAHTAHSLHTQRALAAPHSTHPTPRSRHTLPHTSLLLLGTIVALILVSPSPPSAARVAVCVLHFAFCPSSPSPLPAPLSALRDVCGWHQSECHRALPRDCAGAVRVRAACLLRVQSSRQRSGSSTHTHSTHPNTPRPTQSAPHTSGQTCTSCSAG